MNDAPTFAFATSSKPATALSTITYIFLKQLPSLSSMKQKSFDYALVLLAQPATLIIFPTNSS
jgi:hypothetical protein